MIVRTLAWLALAASLSASAQPRANAVFVLGEDVPPHAPYFAPATEYHRSRAQDGDLVVTTARSLEEVREWLARSPLRGGQPWGQVTVVAHGSPWVGLAPPLFRRGAPATRSQLEAAIATGAFPPLGDAIFDDGTVLHLDSCGVGRRADLVQLYGEIFGGRDAGVPRVLASREWIEYGIAEGARGASATWRRERPFVAAIVAQRTLGPRDEEILRARLASQLGATNTSPPRWTTSHVRVEAAMAEAAVCARAPAKRLARQPEVSRVLGDYDIAASSLAWRYERQAGGCILIGEGTLATLGTGELPASALPAMAP